MSPPGPTPRTEGRPPRALRLLAPIARAAAWAAILASTGALAQPRAFVADHERSRIVAVTGRAGSLGFLGHEHAVLATDASARICLDPERPAESSAEVVVPAASLVLDSDAAMAAAGTSSRPDPETVADLQERMLGPEFLDVARHPEMSFASTGVEAADASSLRVEGRFTLHGRTRLLEVPVRLTRLQDGAVRFRATLTTRMSGYGIEPESQLGLVEVADEFRVIVDVVARPTNGPCDGTTRDR